MPSQRTHAACGCIPVWPHRSQPFPLQYGQDWLKWVGSSSLNPAPQILQMGIVASVTSLFLPRILIAPAPSAVAFWTAWRIFFVDIELSMPPISISTSCVSIGSSGLASQIFPSTMRISFPSSLASVFNSVVWLPFTWCSNGANRSTCSCLDNEVRWSTISSSVHTFRGLSHWRQWRTP